MSCPRVGEKTLWPKKCRALCLGRKNEVTTDSEHLLCARCPLGLSILWSQVLSDLTEEKKGVTGTGFEHPSLALERLPHKLEGQCSLVLCVVSVGKKQEP